MISTPDLVSRFNSIVAELRAKTNASRTTLRLDDDERGFRVAGVVAEALGPGVKSIAAETSVQQRISATVSHLDKYRKILVQNDCAAAEPRPPQELMHVYGTKAQMMAPIVRQGKMVGWLSVHYNPAVREWTRDDVDALEEALAATHRELDRATAPAPHLADAVDPAAAPAVEPPPPETPIDPARVHATDKVPEPDSLGG